MAAAAFIAAPVAADPQGPARVRMAPASRFLGARVWSGDGEPRLDFEMDGGAIILGHAFAPVEAAVAEASSDALERASGALSALLPCAEAVRFAAEEAHALPAAIAAARRATGRRRALVWGLDAGPLGEASDIAALVLDPLGRAPAELHAARRLASDAGAVLIFDETVSGFRVHDNGAQGLSGVTPDLCVHGASLANGRPLGAVAGRRELIAALDDGDLPEPRQASLAACAVTLTYLGLQPAAPDLRVLGAELQAEVAGLVERSGAHRVFALDGDPALPTPLFAAPQLEGLWLRESARLGLIASGPHALSAAHGEPEVARLVQAYTDILPLMVASGLLESLLRPLSNIPSFQPSFGNS